MGNGAHFPPLVVYVSRWFDRRRGTAVALISSGQYIAGVIWPTVFERGLTRFGWQATMLGYAVVVVAAIVPMAALFLAPPPAPVPGLTAPLATGVRAHPRALGLQRQTGAGSSVRGGVSVLRADGDAGGHLVAFCSDIGIAPAQGAAMLSVLLGCAFVSR